MYFLVFDTTAAACSVLLREDEKKVAAVSRRMDFGQSEALIPQIQEVLSAAGLKFADISLLAVCVGPGSFTGVRSSIAAARTFKLACPNLQLAGVSAFEAGILSFAPTELAAVNAVIIETKRNDFYVQLFDERRQKLTPPQALMYEDILPLLRGRRVSLTGDGVERFLSRPSGLALHCVQTPDVLDIELVADAGWNQLQNKRLDYPKPLYLRAPDVTLPKSNQS